MTVSSLIGRYRVDWTDAELDSVIAQAAGELPDLKTCSIDQAMGAIDSCLSVLIVPSAQMRDGVRTLHALARVASEQLFADECSYLRRLYSEAPKPCALPVKCFCGLSGAGKSEIAAAFLRSLPKAIDLEIPNHTNARLLHAHLLTAKVGIGIGQFLEPVIRGHKDAGRNVLALARRQLAKHATALLAGDELQFVSQGDAALRVSNLLLQICQLGPAFAFFCNFSLVHRLRDRPHEFRERLLSDIVVIEPDSADCEDWRCHVRSVLGVDPAFAELLNRKEIEFDVHNFTFGIKRLVRRLAVLSYGEARARGSFVVSFLDVERAYLSLKYASARRDVELLTAGELGSLKKHKDLWCPLETVRSARLSHQRQQAQGQREADLGEAALGASLTRQERSGLARVQAASQAAKPERPRRPKVTGDALRSGAKAYAKPGKRTA